MELGVSNVVYVPKKYLRVLPPNLCFYRRGLCKMIIRQTKGTHRTIIAPCTNALHDLTWKIPQQPGLWLIACDYTNPTNWRLPESRVRYKTEAGLRQLFLGDLPVFLAPFFLPFYQCNTSQLEMVQGLSFHDRNLKGRREAHSTFFNHLLPPFPTT